MTAPLYHARSPVPLMERLVRKEMPMSAPRDDPGVQAVRLATLAAELSRVLARAAERAQQISELADALERQP